MEQNFTIIRKREALQDLAIQSHIAVTTLRFPANSILWLQENAEWLVFIQQSTYPRLFMISKKDKLSVIQRLEPNVVDILQSKDVLLNLLVFLQRTMPTDRYGYCGWVEKKYVYVLLNQEMLNKPHEWILCQSPYVLSLEEIEQVRAHFISK